MVCVCILQKVINQFAQLGEDPRVSFFGNVMVGQDVTLSELRALYDGVSLLTVMEGATQTCTGHTLAHSVLLWVLHAADTIWVGFCISLNG